MGLMINPAPTFTLNNGDIASEGKLHFFENGSTSIRKPVYIDPELNSQLNNPLTLTDAGRLPTCFGTGTYTIVLESADLVQQWVRNDVAIDDLSGQFSDYSSVKIYLTNEIVRYTDGNYYFSEKNNNRGNTPSSDSEWWSQIGFLEFFNSSKAAGNAYKLNDIVIDGGFLYRSLENNNGDTPPSAKWANLTFNDSVAGDFTIGGNLTVTGDILSPVQFQDPIPVMQGGTGADNAADAIVNLGLGTASEENYISEMVALNGDFNGSFSIKCVRIGDLVTITLPRLATHSLSANPISAAGLIPLMYRPSDISSNVFYMFTSPDTIASISIYAGGDLALTYSDFSGVGASRTSPPSNATISYIV